MSTDEYVQMMYFYRNFIKDVLTELMDIIGKRGTIAVLRESSRRFAQSKIIQNPIPQRGIKNAFKFLLNLGKTEFSDDETILTLNKCPFKVRSFRKAGSIEEITFCNICWGFVNGIADFFNHSRYGLVRNRARGFRNCKFKSLY